jgi:hypothetical protein
LSTSQAMSVRFLKVVVRMPWSDVVACSASEREEQDAVDVTEDRRDDVLRDIPRRLLGDPVVESVQLSAHPGDGAAIALLRRAQPFHGV